MNEHNPSSHNAIRRFVNAKLRPAQLALLPDADHRSGEASPQSKRLAKSLLVARYWAFGLVALAAVIGRVEASPVVGATAAQINQNFVPTMMRYLVAKRTHGGSAELYKYFWSMSSFQFYEFCVVFQKSPGGYSCYILFGNLLGVASHAAINRLTTVNLMYNQSIYATSIPGGRKRIQKIVPTIGGWPPQTTLMQAWAECTAATGDAAQGLGLLVRTLIPEGVIWFGGGYVVGTVMSNLIQTYDPTLQRAIGDAIGPVIDGVAFTATFDTDLLIQQINAIDLLGSPGLNEADFGGEQLGDESLGALKTGQGGL
jgi:hypothetical protein